MRLYLLGAALFVVQALAASVPVHSRSEKSIALIQRQDPLPIGWWQWIKNGANNVVPLSLFWSSVTGQMERFLGEPEATEAITLLARMMGASKNSAGYMLQFASKSHGIYGIVSAPKDAAPRLKYLEPVVDVKDSRRVKIRYGPYLVPNSNNKNRIGAQGMLSGYPHVDMQRPCAGSCTILGATPGLEFLDGSNANVDSGLWLHHFALLNVGQGRQDITCAHRDVSLPHVVLGATPRNSERIFAAGNERTPLSFSQHGAMDIGYKLRPTDKLSSQIELWNDNPRDATVWITITWDYVEGHPFKDDVKVIWLDARQCGTSEVNPPSDRDKFRLEYTWNSTIDAQILGIGGHLHDGGSNIDVSVDGNEVCSSQTRYGTLPEFIGRANPGGHDHGETVGMKHISEQSACYGNGLRIKTVRKGQMWKIEGYYDIDEHGADRHVDGSLDEVMAIALLYVRVPGDVVP